jgi:Protein of unknown function (DUF3568)
MRRTSAILLTACLAALGACRSNDLGSGANTVERDFATPADDVWKASVKAAESMDLRISRNAHDKFGGDFLASRANGDEIRVHVVSLDERHSRVSVRVGAGDRTLATMLQERIAEKMGLAEAKAALLGGNLIEATYTIDLSLAMLSARRAFRTLQATLTDEETHAEWARIDGRLKESTPVRIRIDQVEPCRMRVTFICGTARTEENRDFARRMKDEFEAAGSPKASTY